MLKIYKNTSQKTLHCGNLYMKPGEKINSIKVKPGTFTHKVLSKWVATGAVKIIVTGTEAPAPEAVDGTTSEVVEVPEVTVIEPVLEVATEPIPEPTPEPVVEEPVVESAPETVEEPIVEEVSVVEAPAKKKSGKKSNKD